MNKIGNPVKNQAGSSRFDTVLKMLLIAIVALGSFCSGVFFGKQLSDNDYQLKALESDFNNSHAAKTAENENSAEESINQEEVAALSEKLVSGEKNAEKEEAAHAEERKVASNSEEAHDTHDAHSAGAHGDTHGDAHADAHASAHGAAGHEAKGHDAHQAANAHEASAHAAAAHDQHDAHAATPVAHAAPAGHGAQKPDLTAATKAAMRVANNAAPIETEKHAKESRVPTSLPKTVGLSQDVEFTVQVASFPTAEIAKEHADDLIKKGFPAFPVEATVNGKVWYRVSVGSFKTQKEATLYRAQLLKQTNLPSAIVQKITR
jgi:cell division septation protein DedD